MKVRILKVSQETKPTAKGSYEMLTVNYRNVETDKNGSTRIPDFSAPDAFNALKNAAPDSTWEVKIQASEKGGQKYFNWVGAQPIEGGTVPEEDKKPPVARYTSQTSRDWETKEERAARQRLIVRQSSVTAAIALAQLGATTDGGVDDILKTAEQVENWVFRTGGAGKTPLGDVTKALMEMKNDVPA